MHNQTMRKIFHMCQKHEEPILYQSTLKFKLKIYIIINKYLRTFIIFIKFFIIIIFSYRTDFIRRIFAGDYRLDLHA